MTHELILTSVSQGLEPSAQGFCSVAESGMLSPPLTVFLRSISGYRHLFKPGSEETPPNPVVHSHLLVSASETSYHVLSRTTDVGVDFQHQPNRLAHHVVLQADECVMEGPAWVLAQTGFHFTEWLTPAVRFSQGRPIPTLPVMPTLLRSQQIDRERQQLDVPGMKPFQDSPPLADTPCPFWKRLTGDAGWGGVLAATVRTGRPAILLFRPGMNILPLFIEALALIPSAMRWKATFCTYFTDYPENVVCQWKAIPVDLPEARQFRDDPTALLLDLTKPLPQAPDGPYVEFARHGVENTLPENEAKADLFEDVPELYEEFASASDVYLPETEDHTTADNIEPSLPIPPPFPVSLAASVTLPTAPPAVELMPILIRTSSQKTPNIVGAFLNMKSRGVFYTIFAATFFCVLFLSVIVADQLLEIGLFSASASKPGESEKGKSGAAATKKDSDGPKAPPLEIEKEPNPEDKTVAVAKGEQEKDPELLKQERKEATEQARRILAEKLDSFLDDFPAPKSLPFRVPDPADPEKHQVFTEFAPLFDYGLAVHFEMVPLLRNPRLQIETQRKDHFLDEDSQTETQETDPDERTPAPNRFEWLVLGVNTATNHATPLLLLKLTAEGLSIDWLAAAVAPQYADDVALLKFGFLRYGIGGAKKMTKIGRVPLFDTKIVDPICPAKVFAGSETVNVNIPTPLADEPWKSIFEREDVYYSLRLDVVVHPENPAGISKVELFQESPSRLTITIETTITSKRNDGPGRDSEHPVVVLFEAVAEPGNIQWTDRFANIREELNKEQETLPAQIDKIGKEINEISQKLINIGNKDSSELRRERNELNESRRQLDTRRKEIDSILSKLPDAHDKVVKNEEFRFEYSLFLLPRDGAADSEPPRLSGEESVRLMETR